MAIADSKQGLVLPDLYEFLCAFCHTLYWKGTPHILLAKFPKLEVLSEQHFIISLFILQSVIYSQRRRDA